MKKRIISSLLALIMVVGFVPQISLAADENINVTVTFDVSVIATDTETLYYDLLASHIIDNETTNLPSPVTVSVPKNSTVQTVLNAAQTKAGFTAVGIDDGYVTQIGFVGNDILENLVSIPLGDYYSGNVFNSAGWSFYLNGVTLSSGIGDATIAEDGAVLKGRFGLVTSWDLDWNAVHYDEIFLANYKKLKELTKTSVDMSNFSESQKQTFSNKKEKAESLLKKIYDEASLNEDVAATLLEIHPDFKTSGGMWIGYIEKKGTTFWGTDSPSEQLESMINELNAAMNPLPENMLTELYVTTLFGTAEENLIDNFESDKHQYVIKDYTKDNSLPKFIKWKSVAASENATVSVTLNGETVSPSDLSDDWKQYNNLDWTSGICNTLVFTVTPQEESNLPQSVYTVKIHPELSDTQKISLAKELLSWDKIKGVNNSVHTVTSSLVLPSEIEIPDIGNVQVSWSGIDGEILAEGGVLVSRPQSATKISLLATLISGESSDAVTFDITVLPETEKEKRDAFISELLENIAKTYTEKTSYWEAMDMGAYKKYSSETESVLSGDARQLLINEGIKCVSESDKDADIAKAILAFVATGVDATQLYNVNSNTPINAINKLNSTRHSTSAWSAPYTIAAYNIDGFENREKELLLVNELLVNQEDCGAWDEYGTIDTTANAIMGLSFYLNDHDEVLKENVSRAIKDGLAYLSAQQNADGSFSDSWSGRNSNSTAMVAIALAAAGVDIENDARFIKDGNTITDGLLSFALEDGSGFGYTDNVSASDYSTEQAFRALIAIAGAIKTGAAYNVYDFDGIPLSPARAMDTYTGGAGPALPQGDNISVTLTIKADNRNWLSSYNVNLPGNGATVYHAFIKGCNENGLTYKGADEGYISSISNGNKTLSEFGAGENSGWLYRLNGDIPSLGIRECKIQDGDSIQFFYTSDYTKEPGVRGLSTSKTEDMVEESNDTAMNEITFTDVKKDDWYYESVKYVYEKGLMQGMGNGFAPETKMSRAMLVTILYRMVKPESVENTHGFKDVPEGQWYSDAISWAASNGIVSGISSTEFAPDSDISREQIALIIYRFAKMQGYDTSDVADISDFADAADVSDWALDALSWANKVGIIKGTSDTTLSPKAAATRAQVAAIIIRFCETLAK